VLVSNALCIYANPLDRKNPVLLTQPAAVELVIRYDPKEEDADTSSEQPSDQENDLPRLNSSSGLSTPDSDTVSDTSTEDLRPSVEAEPNASA
jgi:hypothetical protein